MRKFTLAAVLAAAGLIGSTSGADAQVIGTGPLTVSRNNGPGLSYTYGYYSPYPGGLYSPFANNSNTTGYYDTFSGPSYNTFGNGYNAGYPGGYGNGFYGSPYVLPRAYSQPTPAASVRGTQFYYNR